MGFIIIWWDPGVPTNISNVYIVIISKDTDVCYQDFTCVLSLFGEIQVCLPTFPMSLVIISKDPGVPTKI